MNICPLPPSGVQAATAIVPPGRATRTSSAAACSCRGANITPNVDSTRSKEPSAIGQFLRVALDPLAIHACLGRAPAGRVEQLRGEVETRDRCAALGTEDRDIAAAGRDVEHVVAPLDTRPMLDTVPGGGLDSLRDVRDSRPRTTSRAGPA